MYALLGILQDGILYIFVRVNTRTGFLHAFEAWRLASPRRRFQYVASTGFPGPLAIPFKISARRRVRAFSTAELTFADFLSSRISAFIAASSFCIAAFVIHGIVPQTVSYRAKCANALLAIKCRSMLGRCVWRCARAYAGRFPPYRGTQTSHQAIRLSRESYASLFAA